MDQESSNSSAKEKMDQESGNSSTRDKVEGNLHRAKGAVKESVGHTIGNEKMLAVFYFFVWR